METVNLKSSISFPSTTEIQRTLKMLITEMCYKVYKFSCLSLNVFLYL